MPAQCHYLVSGHQRIFQRQWLPRAFVQRRYACNHPSVNRPAASVPLQLAEGLDDRPARRGTKTLNERTDRTWLTHGLCLGSPAIRRFTDVFWWWTTGAPITAQFSYGHIGDLLTLCSMLRIPVCAHMEEQDVFDWVPGTPSAWISKEGLIIELAPLMAIVQIVY